MEAGKEVLRNLFNIASELNDKGVMNFLAMADVLLKAILDRKARNRALSMAAKSKAGKSVYGASIFSMDSRR